MFDAIVLAGGSARRLGGIDKPGLELGGMSLLRRVVDSVAAAARVVVVGPRPASAAGLTAVTWCLEDPPGGGPVAAVAAAQAYLASDLVVLLAADLPWIAGAVPALLDAVCGHQAAVLTDGSGRDNLVAAAWQRRALDAALTAVGEPVGCPLRRLYENVDLARVPDQGWGQDCDTWEDVEAARSRVAPSSDEGVPT